MGSTTENIPVDEKLFNAITNDAVKSAEAAGLIYVMSGARPRYLRVRNGSGFYYIDGKRKLRDKKELDRIKKLVLPQK